jgi:hypothetical protein
MITVFRIGTALVWLIFGVVFKVLGAVPRHRLIVASVLGGPAAGPVAVLIGVAEAAMGLWILSGIRPRTCATVQTIAIATMNALELSLARNLLLAPIPMVCTNAAFLALVWYCALKAPAASRAT